MSLTGAIAFTLVLLLHGSAMAKGAAEHVVLIVLDGLRPDSVTPEQTPVLHRLAQSGVFFAHHRASFPTMTGVNGASLATGVYPARNSIVANNEYRPEINALEGVSVQKEAVVARGDELSGGRHVGVPTIAETLQKLGHRTAIAGTKGVALLHNRRPDPVTKSATIFDGRVLPPGALDTPIGVYPLEIQRPNIESDTWTTRALIEGLWKEGLPKYSVLWLSEPDYSQHFTSPGSEMALAALQSSDTRVGEVLQAIDAKGGREKTDVLIVSDHGFSTVERAHDIVTVLINAGFNASSRFKEPPKTGDVLCVANGGTLLLYVVGQDEAVKARLVEFLQQSEFAGVIFTRTAMEGTFALDELGLNTSAPPDVLMAFRWREGSNRFGVRGLIEADAQRTAGKGTHATLSPYDLGNTLIAAGPDFRPGLRSEVPSRNLDVAPTIYWIFGVEPPQPLDGRVLVEALTNSDAKAPEAKLIERVAERKVGNGVWRQYLKKSEIGSGYCIEEGNGSFTPAQ